MLRLECCRFFVRHHQSHIIWERFVLWDYESVLIHVQNRFYGICPKTDPSHLGLDQLAAEVKDYTTLVGSCTNLNSETCLGEFGIGSADGASYVDPNNLPSGGTDPLSTTTGVGYPLTSPPGGVTMTVTLLDATHTITAAAYSVSTGDSSSSTTSSSGSESGSGSGSGSDSGSRSGSSSSSGSGSSATSASAKGNAGVSTFSAPPLLAYIAFMCCICVGSLWLRHVSLRLMARKLWFDTEQNQAQFMTVNFQSRHSYVVKSRKTSIGTQTRTEPKACLLWY